MPSGHYPRKPKTHCKRGHALSGTNLYIYPSGWRGCRVCRKAHSSKQRSTPEYKEYMRRYTPQWLKSNPEKAREIRLRYYRNNTETVLETNRRWCKRNPDYVKAAGLRKARKRLAIKKSQLGLWHHMETQIEELLYRSQEGCCFYCQEILDWENRRNSPLEHMIPLSRGGTHGIENWCISCRTCNSKKHTKTAKEFLARRQ